MPNREMLRFRDGAFSVGITLQDTKYLQCFSGYYGNCCTTDVNVNTIATM